MTGAAAPPPMPGMGGAGEMSDAMMPAPEEPAANAAQPPGVQGMSPVEMGTGVGTQGGRPQSAQGTQATSQPRPATAPQR